MTHSEKASATAMEEISAAFAEDANWRKSPSNRVTGRWSRLWHWASRQNAKINLPIHDSTGTEIKNPDIQARVHRVNDVVLALKEHINSAGWKADDIFIHQNMNTTPPYVFLRRAPVNLIATLRARAKQAAMQKHTAA